MIFTRDVYLRKLANFYFRNYEMSRINQFAAETLIELPLVQFGFEANRKALKLLITANCEHIGI